MRPCLSLVATKAAMLRVSISAMRAEDVLMPEQSKRPHRYGPVTEYSGKNNLTLQEALAWVTGASTEGLTSDRTDLKKSNSLLVCHCTKCDAHGLVRMNTQCHFCKLEDGIYQEGYWNSGLDSSVIISRIYRPATTSLKRENHVLL